MHYYFHTHQTRIQTLGSEFLEELRSTNEKTYICSKVIEHPINAYLEYKKEARIKSYA